jgi:VWFA-related protein
MAASVLFTLALAVAGQDAALTAGAAPPVPPAEIDAVVLDAGGRRLDNLAVEDFVLTEGGTPLAIDSVRFVASEPRLFGFFLDEYHVTPGEAADRARRTLARFVERHFAPGDRALVVKPLDSLLDLRLTADRQDVLREIGVFQGRKGLYTPRDEFERQLIAGDPDRVDAIRAQISTSGLTALATHLSGAAPGRKTLIVLSEGFVARSPGRGEELLPTVQTLTRVANRGKVAMYPIHPQAFGARASGESSLATLSLLATETGGQVIARPEALESELQRMVSDASGYYMVAFRPATRDGRGRFYPVELRVRARDAQLRARKAYWAPFADVVRAATASGAAPNRVPNLPRRSSPLIRPWFGLSRGEPGKTRVRFAWEPASPIPGDRSRLLPPASINLKAIGGDGLLVFEATVREGDGAEFDVQPGRLRVQMTIADAAARVLDTDVRDVAITPLDGTVALGSLQVFRARNALEFRDLASRSSAMPSPSRVFSRSERLLIRFPVYAPETAPNVSASLVSRQGSRLRDLSISRGPNHPERQIDVSLAGLAAGEYRVEVAVASAAGSARDILRFRVIP